MKAKYLFYSLALASAFTACTQDEMFDAPALNSNDVTGRPVAGVVTFVNDEVDSRYNSEAAKFESGDQMGLYLMDEFTGIGEELNANNTHWTWQSCWWNMYNMVDYINTNYGYVYNAETGEWVNRASQLIEGNYIAMFPQNTRATNRQDLWHPIKSNVDLVDHSSTPRYYVNRENQFFLGYEQIMRDQKAGAETGELTANISMKPILTYAKMYFENQSANDFKIKKVVFKAPGGAALPNIAYVTPSEITRTVSGYKILNKHNVNVTAPVWGFNNYNAIIDGLEDECGTLVAWSKYDRTTYNHAAARSMVSYATTTQKVPYGMTEAEAVPTYEYVFNFPADADILKANQAPAAERVCGISIALPAFKGWQNMEVVVYGEMWDQTANDMKGAWRPGIIRKMMNKDNGEFTLNQLKLWTLDSKMDIPSVTARFDDNQFYQQEELRVSTTKDLYDLINARLSSASNTENVYFEVQHYGNGLEITKEVVDLIKNYEKAHNVDVVVTFANRDYVETPVVFVTENAIDEFDYLGVNVVVEAPQTITTVPVEGIWELRNFSTINVEGAKNLYTAELQAEQIINEIGATFNTNYAAIEGNIHNESTLALKDSYVDGSISNAAIMSNTGTTTVTGDIVNDNACVNCGDDKAVLTVGGALTVDNLTNADEVIVNGKLVIVTEFANAGTTTVAATGSIEGGNMTNTGKLENKGAIKLEMVVNKNLIENYGYIKAINNFAVVNAYEGTDIDGIFNNILVKGLAELHVWSTEVDVLMSKGSEGITIFEGVDAQHVGNYVGKEDQCPAELRVYRAYEEKTATSLLETFAVVKYEEIWTKYDIHFDAAMTSCGVTFNKIKVEAGEVTFTADKKACSDKHGAFELFNVVFEVVKNAILNIEDASSIRCKDVINDGTVHVGTGSTLWVGGTTTNNLGGAEQFKGHQVD